MLSGKILITGGTGSLGSAILARAQKESWDAQFTIVARNETKMNETLKRFPEVNGKIGDVRDLDWLKTIFPGHDLVIHAAAIKIVPVAESSPREAVLTNVIGSMNVAQAAIDARVPSVVGVSTDKACGPTYYGLTKRLMEGIFRQARSWGSTKFTLCRYGNVLKSANSIVPLFMSQIEKDIPFTVTDKRMTRFWLSMEQAIDLVIEAQKMPNGTILVPKAPSMSIVNLAHALDPRREIVEIGIRPGERLHETLIVREEAMHTIEFPETFVIYPPDYAGIDSNVGFQFEYTSDKPDHWLTNAEMTRLLRDS